MRCVHHNDADGLCAAAIVKNEFGVVWENVNADNFVEYCHNGIINIKDETEFFKPGQTIYIVDLALDHYIFDEIIRKAINNKCNVVHIDHHISGKKFLEGLRDEDRKLYDDNVISFWTDKYSGCMLTWVYSCMVEDQRKHPNDVEFDLTEDHSSVAIDPNGSIRVCNIPLAVRLIDDNDVWRHKFRESKLFSSAFGAEENTRPYNDEFWAPLLYEGPAKTYEIIDRGVIINGFIERQSKSIMKNAFEIEIDGFKGIACNFPVGNSLVFGEAYDTHDFVIKFNQVSDRNWRYTLYSKEDGGADCEELVKKYFSDLGLCGGHKHSAGATLDRNIFQKYNPKLDAWVRCN